MAEMPAIRGVTPAIETVYWVWENPMGSNMTLTFQNGRVFAKPQAGMR